MQGSLATRLGAWPLLAGAALLLTRCAGATPTPLAPAQVPSASPVPPASSSAVTKGPPPDPFAIPRGLRHETLPPTDLPQIDTSKLALPPMAAPPKKGAKAAGVSYPPPPASCKAYADRKAKKAAACKEAPEALKLLEEAISDSDTASRDTKLVALEGCASFSRGLIRALRVELAPEGCGDAMVAPVLAAKPPPDPQMIPVLVGLGVAARLRRLPANPPQLKPPFEKQRVKEFVSGPVAEWLTAQATAIQDLSTIGSELQFYARGVVAIEAGLADMRLVESVRDLPIPDEIAKDQELKDAYFASLESGLDPRKERGRTASLVAMRDFWAVGDLTDARVGKARTLISKMFGGRRIDALDGLIVPPAPETTPNTVEQRLAAKLPTFYAGLVLPAEVAKDPSVLRILSQRGIAVRQRRALAQGELAPDLAEPMMRFRVAMGQRYWDSVAWEETIRLAQSLGGKPGGESVPTFMLALGLALYGGPDNAVDMVGRAPTLALGFGNTAALDTIAATKDPLAGAAAFDAALMVQLSPSGRPDAAFWTQVASRFRDAASKLPDAKQRTAAETRAEGGR